MGPAYTGGAWSLGTFATLNNFLAWPICLTALGLIFLESYQVPLTLTLIKTLTRTLTLTLPLALGLIFLESYQVTVTLPLPLPLPLT